MRRYKIVLEVDCDYGEEDLREVLGRLLAMPEATFENCTHFDATVLALAETQESRARRDAEGARESTEGSHGQNRRDGR